MRGAPYASQFAPTAPGTPAGWQAMPPPHPLHGTSPWPTQDARWVPSLPPGPHDASWGWAGGYPSQVLPPPSHMMRVAQAGPNVMTHGQPMASQGMQAAMAMQASAGARGGTIMVHHAPPHMAMPPPPHGHMPQWVAPPPPTWHAMPPHMMARAPGDRMPRHHVLHPVVGMAPTMAAAMHGGVGATVATSMPFGTSIAGQPMGTASASTAAATNARRSKTPNHGFMGITRTRHGRWQAQIHVRGPAMYLGTFSTPREAALVYDIHVLKYKGPTAPRNFPDHDPTVLREQLRPPGSVGGANYKGVAKAGTLWRAKLYHKGKSIVLGHFDTAKAAALAYDKRARELRGPKTRTNFPPPEEEGAPPLWVRRKAAQEKHQLERANKRQRVGSAGSAASGCSQGGGDTTAATTAPPAVVTTEGVGNEGVAAAAGQQPQPAGQATAVTAAAGEDATVPTTTTTTTPTPAPTPTPAGADGVATGDVTSVQAGGAPQREHDGETPTATPTATATAAAAAAVAADGEVASPEQHATPAPSSVDVSASPSMPAPEADTPGGVGATQSNGDRDGVPTDGAVIVTAVA